MEGNGRFVSKELIVKHEWAAVSTMLQRLRLQVEHKKSLHITPQKHHRITSQIKNNMLSEGTDTIFCCLLCNLYEFLTPWYALVQCGLGFYCKINHCSAFY